VERGKHEELLANEGLYREIYDLQLKDQEEFAEIEAGVDNGEQHQAEQLQLASAHRG
jgi:hypothetical protein